MNNNPNILDLVDQYNLTLIKLPSEKVELYGYSRRYKIPDGAEIVWMLVKKDCSAATWEKMYAPYESFELRGSDVYRKFVRDIKTTDEPRWACFVNN